MNQGNENRFDLLSYLYCFIGVFFFSTTEIAGKFAGDAISPVFITIVRFFFGSALLLPFAAYQLRGKNLRISLGDIFSMVYPGVLNVAGAMLFLQFAIYYGKASTSAMLISSNPVFVAIFAVFILKEKLNRAKIIGVLLGLMGVLFVIIGDDPLSASASNPFLGLLFGVLASVFFALYTVLAKKRIAVFGNFFFNTISFAGGALVLLIVASLLRLNFTFEITSNNILLLLYMGVFITGVAYIFFFAGLKKVPAANGSMFFFFKPIIAVLLAYFILQETITFLQFIGIISIIAGIYITNVRHRRPA